MGKLVIIRPWFELDKEWFTPTIEKMVVGYIEEVNIKSLII